MKGNGRYFPRLGWSRSPVEKVKPSAKTYRRDEAKREAKRAAADWEGEW